MPIRLQVNQPATPHDSELMSLHTYLTGHGSMSQWSRSAFLSQPVHPQINQSRHLDPSSMDQVVHPCPRSDHTRPSLNKHTKLNTHGLHHLVLASQVHFWPLSKVLQKLIKIHENSWKIPQEGFPSTESNPKVRIMWNLTLVSPADGHGQSLPEPAKALVQCH